MIRLNALRRAMRLPMLAGAVMLALSPLPLLADRDHDRALELRREGRILALEQILANLREVQEGDVLEVELEYEDRHGRVVYEVKVIDGQAGVWELYFDAETGELLERERDR